MRRTDKLKVEAKYHAVETYMTQVENYYAKLDLLRPHTTRRVYLATDEPKVILEATKMYVTEAPSVII